jgi:hypothetical protein
MARGVEVLGEREVSAMLAEVERDVALTGKPGKQAAVLVARTAASFGPDRSGDLSRSYKGLGGKRMGRVVSRAAHNRGRTDKATYAPIIEYGWPGHNIEKQERVQRGLKANESTIRALFEEHVRGVLRAKGVLK